MDWLGGWLKTIIMAILLASFVDLLLPNNKMQRYVKTVMSLFILLTLLTPILQLFQHKGSIDDMLTAAMQKQSIMDRKESSGQHGGLASLEAITQEANKLKAINVQQSQELLQKQIADAITADLQKQTELQVDQVQVLTKIDNNGKPSITDIQVSLHEIKAKASEVKRQADRTLAAIAPVQTMQPVRINIFADKAASTSPGMSPSSDTASSWDHEKSKLIDSLSRDWLVPKARIAVHIG
ncbi:stage III sporulation protein AF [Paenibacillus sp. GP183]|jgi:stage III sporulation protein AF|uniref:stage III sporulation protein AF n=1 Tax=Paenibacillus sp. GP183 TaxID=1882751 RepID=UPI00089C2FBC|nr:stage III sporulation protein AF [Paenibacillus sp. GP183]SEB69360.1 stage III sporulation protein AF [Paenibacillus sp. GP183]